MRIDCPICKKVLEHVAEDFGPRPFCGPRCKLVDLGNWLNGAYRIPGEDAREDGDDDDDVRSLS